MNDSCEQTHELTLQKTPSKNPPDNGCPDDYCACHFDGNHAHHTGVPRPAVATLPMATPGQARLFADAPLESAPSDTALPVHRWTIPVLPGAPIVPLPYDFPVPLPPCNGGAGRGLADDAAHGLAFDRTPRRSGECPSLDGLETTPLPPWERTFEDVAEPAPLGASFRHAGWDPSRRKVWKALNRVEVPNSRLEAFRLCGATCFILRSKNDPGKVRLAATTCHDRFCIPCARDRSRTIANNVGVYIEKQNCRFITLTMKQRTEPLSSELNRLYDNFAALRKTKLWKKAVWGGVAFLEVKRSRDGERWHPHLHCLVQGKYIDQALLSKMWLQITKDSHVVDIRAVRDQANCVAYITKYASKPFDKAVLDNPASLDEAIIALHGRRMIVTFGKWKGLQVTEKPADGEWEIVGSLEDLCARAAGGDAESRELVEKACGVHAHRLIARSRAVVVPQKEPDKPLPKIDQLIFTYPEHMAY